MDFSDDRELQADKKPEGPEIRNVISYTPDELKNIGNGNLAVEKANLQIEDVDQFKLLGREEYELRRIEEEKRRATRKRRWDEHAIPDIVHYVITATGERGRCSLEQAMGYYRNGLFTSEMKFAVVHLRTDLREERVWHTLEELILRNGKAMPFIFVNRKVIWDIGLLRTACRVLAERRKDVVAALAALQERSTHISQEMAQIAARLAKVEEPEKKVDPLKLIRPCEATEGAPACDIDTAAGWIVQCFGQCQKKKLMYRNWKFFTHDVKCPVCHCWLLNAIELLEHFTGKKHSKRVKKSVGPGYDPFDKAALVYWIEEAELCTPKKKKMSSQSKEKTPDNYLQVVKKEIEETSPENVSDMRLPLPIAILMPCLEEEDRVPEFMVEIMLDKIRTSIDQCDKQKIDDIVHSEVGSDTRCLYCDVTITALGFIEHFISEAHLEMIYYMIDTASFKFWEGIIKSCIEPVELAVAEENAIVTSQREVIEEMKIGTMHPTEPILETKPLLTTESTAPQDYGPVPRYPNIVEQKEGSLAVALFKCTLLLIVFHFFPDVFASYDWALRAHGASMFYVFLRIAVDDEFAERMNRLAEPHVQPIKDSVEKWKRVLFKLLATVARTPTVVYEARSDEEDVTEKGAIIYLQREVMKEFDTGTVLTFELHTATRPLIGTEAVSPNSVVPTHRYPVFLEQKEGSLALAILKCLLLLLLFLVTPGFILNYTWALYLFRALMCYAFAQMIVADELCVERFNEKAELHVKPIKESLEKWKRSILNLTYRCCIGGFN